MPSTPNFPTARTVASAVNEGLAEDPLARVGRPSSHPVKTFSLPVSYRAPNANPPSNETSIIHTLTGWVPEPIPLKYRSSSSLFVNHGLFHVRYTHAGKVWEFLRYDRSNKLVFENETNKADQHPTSPAPNYGPVPLFKWPEAKAEVPEEPTPTNSNVGVLHLAADTRCTTCSFAFSKNQSFIRMTRLRRH